MKISKSTYRRILFYLKLIVSLSLLIWIYRTDKFDFANIFSSLTNFKLTSTFILLTFAQLIIGAKRTEYLILFGKGSRSRVKNIAIISWASSFIGFISPFNIFGEIFKVSNLINLDKKTSRDNYLYSSIYSKIFSTLALSLISIVPFLVIVSFNNFFLNFLCFLFILILVFLIIFNNRIHEFLDNISNIRNDTSEISFFRKRFRNFLKYNSSLLKDRKGPIKILLASLAIQLLNTYSFFIIIQFLNPSSLDNSFEVFCTIPVGLFLQMLPISYGGLGVGNLAFSKLLQIHSIHNGSDAFSIYFALSFLFNFLGFFPFYYIINYSRTHLTKKSYES